MKNWFNSDKIAAALGYALGETIRDPIVVALGYKDEDGNEFIYVEADDGEQNKYYFHELPGYPPLVGEAYAYGGVIPSEYLKYGMPIRIKIDPLSSNTPRYFVEGLDPVLSGNYAQTNPQKDSRTYIQTDQFIAGSITPTDPPSMIVRFRGAPFTYNGEFLYWKSKNSDEFGVDAEDTLSNPITLPTTATNDKFVLVQVSMTDGTLSYKVGDLFSSALSNASAFELQLNTGDQIFPNPDAGHFRSGYIRLKYNQTAITKASIWSVQEFYTIANAAASTALGGTGSDLSGEGPGFLHLASNGANVSILKHNLSATTDPTTGSDDTQGYEPGSLWVNVTLDKVFFCADNGTGAAIWVQVSGGGSMSSFLIDADSGTPESISDGQTLTIAGGTGISTTVSATDTVTVDLDTPVAVANGGTGANLSAGGGANQVVKMSSLGGPMSAGAITSAEITTALTTPPAIGGTTPAAGTFTTLTGTTLIATQRRINASTELTISAGAITKTQTYHRIDTESDAASDDLDTINGGTSGDELYIRAENTARTISVTNAGNIYTGTGTNIDLDNNEKILHFFYDGSLSKWVIVGGAGGVGGGGTNFDIAGDTGTPETVGDSDTVTIAGGTGISTVVGATNTVTVNLDSPVSIANGGTGQTGATAAFDALSPNTTKGDIAVHNGTNNVRLPVGTNGQVIVADSAEAAGIKWGDAAGGGDAVDISFTPSFGANWPDPDPVNVQEALDSLASDRVDMPLTTKGDILGHNGSILVRVPVGTNGQFLISDSTEAAGIKWADGNLIENALIEILAGEDTVVTTGQLDVSTIPADGVDIIAYARVRSNEAVNYDSLQVFVNADYTVTNYYSQRIVTQNATPDDTESNAPDAGDFPGANADAGRMADLVIRIPNYTSSEAKKIHITTLSSRIDGNIIVGQTLVTWVGTSTIDQITLRPNGYATDAFVSPSYMGVYRTKLTDIGNGVGGGGVTDAADLAYTPLVSSNWNSPIPDDGQEAFDALAGRVRVLENAGLGGGSSGSATVIDDLTDALSGENNLVSGSAITMTLEDNTDDFSTAPTIGGSGPAGKYLTYDATNDRINMGFQGGGSVGAATRTSTSTVLPFGKEYFYLSFAFSMLTYSGTTGQPVVFVGLSNAADSINFGLKPQWWGAATAHGLFPLGSTGLPAVDVGTPVAVAKDLLVHQFEIWRDPSDDRVYVQFDGAGAIKLAADDTMASIEWDHIRYEHAATGAANSGGSAYIDTLNAKALAAVQYSQPNAFPSSFPIANGAQVSWTATTPDDSDVRVFYSISLDDQSTWSDFTECTTNPTVISEIVQGTDITQAWIKYKYILIPNSAYDQVPTLSEVELYVEEVSLSGTALVNTTDDTPTEIANYPLAEGAAVTIQGIIVGFKTTVDEGIGGSFIATARRQVSGNVTLIGSPTYVTTEDSSGTPVISVVADTGAQTVSIRVTGIAATTYKWRVSYTIIPLSD